MGVHGAASVPSLPSGFCSPKTKLIPLLSSFAVKGSALSWAPWTPVFATIFSLMHTQQAVTSWLLGLSKTLL